MERNIPKPIVKEIKYNNESLNNFEQSLEISNKKEESKILFRYPTIYIVNEPEKKPKDSYSVYVGETNDIKRRTNEHLQIDTNGNLFWKNVKSSNQAEMFLIGHNHFNKSLTLDIENRLMHYMSGIESVKNIYNKRTNQQDEYYTSNELDIIFESVWNELRAKKSKLFPPINVIKDSAIFKSSPFQKLTLEQFKAKDQIIAKVEESLNRNSKSGQLILVTGEAGTGKTVLLSNLFYELFKDSEETSDNVILRGRSEMLLVNHDEQVKVYEQIAEKLGMTGKNKRDIVGKPTRFINSYFPNNPDGSVNKDTKVSEDKKIDIILVDEAHLLWTQGKQSYRRDDQLKDLLSIAKVVIAVFDPHQILSTVEYLSDDAINRRILDAAKHNNLIELHNQMRIHGNEKTVKWIRNLVDSTRIGKIPKDKDFDLKIMNSPEELYQAIKIKSQNEKQGISRILATFDWPYINGKTDKNGKPWKVTIDNFSLPWNLQIPAPKKVRNLPWAEQEQTIDEVGSTFTIQGFDLNYAGVIIGPSVKYQNGKIVFDKNFSMNRKAIQKRNGKIDNSEEFLRNELNVLLTRGVNGLYIYAVDKGLQNKLLSVQKGSTQNGK